MNATQNGTQGTQGTDAPDILSRLHTLRSLAHDVKAQADTMRLWVIASHCASISERATEAIDHFNAVIYHAFQ